MRYPKAIFCGFCATLGLSRLRCGHMLYDACMLRGNKSLFTHGASGNRGVGGWGVEPAIR